MDTRFNLSKKVFAELSRQVNDFKKNQNAILDNSTLVPPQERKEYQHLFTQYIDQLEHLLNNAPISDSADHHLPFVTIGSVVELENLQNKRTNKIMVTFPLPNLSNPGKMRQTSYNSPIGRALFLKNPGEKLEVNAPGGLFQYQVKSIILYLS